MAKHPDADLSQLFSELLSQSKALKKRSKLEQLVNTTLTILASIMIIVGTLRVVGFLQAVKDSTENDR